VGEKIGSSGVGNRLAAHCGCAAVGGHDGESRRRARHGDGGSMSTVPIYEVAKELGMDQKALVALFQSMGFGDVRNHMSSVEPELVERVRRHIEKQKSPSIVEERIHPTVVKRRVAGPP